ncbi:hypothetical protein EKPJFOCH_3831 [Methylobacterium thuringiense]|uniref:Uncharacterized protein n=1 Tax=Methylobacterium thuringiense TaxID=1003091 RepID=A0ABQ4TRJ2_9HYPH|nr:hypothetical protein EKPJFOCH_3831 [Methylobacterium thuringiense]
MVREEMKPGLSCDSDPFATLRDAASAAARNLGLDADAQHLSPEHWQRVLAAVEARIRMRGLEVPADWREDLAMQMGRAGLDTPNEPES